MISKRLGEALNLSWRDIDLTRNRISFYREKTSQMAQVPISARLAENLDARRESDEPFPAMDYAIKTLRRKVKEVCNTDERLVKQRGAATIHSTRDTFVTRMEMRGMSKAQVGTLIGHGSIETTKKYSRFMPDDVFEIASKAIG